MAELTELMVALTAIAIVCVSGSRQTEVTDNAEGGDRRGRGD